ncbi:MAG: hypothetical protein ACO1RT_13785 [Planctomycetaceae bacterium]
MPPSTAISPPSWFANRRVRFGISVLLIGHLWAVVGRPFEFATQGPFGSSPSASAFYAPIRGYSQFAYLDHGYAFFAPDPGPSHFIQAAITDSEGVRVEKKYPDLSQQWPRLLYHRHFMLAEFLNDVHHPPGDPPAEIAEDAAASAAWVRARRRYEDVRDSILNHLRYRYPRSEVAIRRMEHRQPGLPEFLQGEVGTRDESLLRVLFDTLDDLPPQNPIPFNVPTETLSAPPAEPVP